MSAFTSSLVLLLLSNFLHFTQRSKRAWNSCFWSVVWLSLVLLWVLVLRLLLFSKLLVGNVLIHGVARSGLVLFKLLQKLLIIMLLNGATCNLRVGVCRKWTIWKVLLLLFSFLSSGGLLLLWWTVCWCCRRCAGRLSKIKELLGHW